MTPQYGLAADQVRALLAIQRPREAAIWANEALADDPNNAELVSLLALSEHGLGDSSAAIAHMRAALALAPNEREINVLAARLFREAGRPRRAVEAARRAVSLSPDNARAAYELVYAELARGDVVAASDAAQTVQRIAPASVLASWAAGAVALDSGQWTDAEQAFRAVLAQEPNNAAALENLAAALAKRGDHDRALDLFEAAGRVDLASDRARTALAETAREKVRAEGLAPKLVETFGPGSSGSMAWIIGPLLASFVLRALDPPSAVLSAALIAVGLFFIAAAIGWRVAERSLSDATQLALEIDRRQFWRRVRRPWRWNGSVFRRLGFAGGIVFCFGLAALAIVNPDESSTAESDRTPVEQALDVDLPEGGSSSEQLAEALDIHYRRFADEICERASASNLQDASRTKTWTPADLACSETDDGTWTSSDFPRLCDLAGRGQLVDITGARLPPLTLACAAHVLR